MQILEQPTNILLGLEPIRRNVYGVEIELEGVSRGWQWRWHDKELTKLWSHKGDPSLRNGVELISAKCTQGQLLSSLPKIEEHIKKNNAKTSLRCGIHVHVNMLNLTWGQCMSFIALFCLLEPYIFRRFAPSRDENHFCVPLYWNTAFTDRLAKDCTMMRNTSTKRITAIMEKNAPNKKPNYKKKAATGGGVFSSPLQPISLDEIPQAGGSKVRSPAARELLTILGTQKYSSLTCYRLGDLGTIELRLMKGTTSAKEIMEFVMALGRIKHMASKCLNPTQVQQMYEQNGIVHAWSQLKSGELPIIDVETKEDAEEAAFKIIGNEPIDYNKLDWNFS